MPASDLSRRRFIQTCGLSLASSPLAASCLGANDEVRLAFIGTGGRGTHHMRQFLTFPESDFLVAF